MSWKYGGTSTSNICIRKNETLKTLRRRVTAMVRELQKADIDKVADIWLDTNIKAHDFIPAQYWESNFESVKELLP